MSALEGMLLTRVGGKPVDPPGEDGVVRVALPETEGELAPGEAEDEDEAEALGVNPGKGPFPRTDRD